MSEWIEEPDVVRGDFAVRLKVERMLYESESAHQKMVLFENGTFGRVLVLDGVIQTTTADEFIYHEMLAHVPLFAHPAPRRVLIVGGGDGGCLEEVLKHARVEHVTMVELDASVIEFARRHLGEICGEAFDDPRLELVIDDGARYVERREAAFDVVIVDSTDPIGPGRVLFQRPFYAACRRCLADGGVMVTQNAISFVYPEWVRAPFRAMRQVFPDVACYTANVPSFFGGAVPFGWASEDASLRRVDLETLETRQRAAGFATRYYAPDVHLGAFALPPYLREWTG